MKKIIVYIVLFTLSCTSMKADRNTFAHVPTTVSPVAQKMLKSMTPSEEHIESVGQWQKVREEFNAQKKEINEKIKKKFIASTEHVQIAGVPVLIATPKGYDTPNDKKIILYIHGGAYTLGKPDFLYTSFAPLAAETGLRVYAVDYRLAPEYPFPAGLKDTLAVYRELVKRFGAKNIAMLGDSAGGALSLATLLKAREESLKPPAALVLYSPWSDIDKIGDSYYTLEGIAPLLHYEKNLRDSAVAYAGKEDMKNPLISPVYANYGGDFPPVLIQVGTKDLFLSNCVRLYRTMKRDGVSVELSAWEGMWHVFEAVPGLPEGEEAVHEAAKFIKRHM